MGAYSGGVNRMTTTTTQIEAPDTLSRAALAADHYQA
jgi:hypothetical protein